MYLYLHFVLHVCTSANYQNTYKAVEQHNINMTFLLLTNVCESKHTVIIKTTDVCLRKHTMHCLTTYKQRQCLLIEEYKHKTDGKITTHMMKQY